MPTIDFSTGNRKEFPNGGVGETVVVGGKVCMKLAVPKGFSWSKDVKPHLPGNPQSCPYTHCGVLQSGKFTVAYDDGNKEEHMEAGDCYVILPGHDVMFTEDTVMFEFSEETKKAMEEVETT